MHWREAFDVETPEVSAPVLQQRLRQVALPIWKKLEKKDRDGYSLYHFDDVLNITEWIQQMNTILAGVPESAWPPPPVPSRNPRQPTTHAEDQVYEISHVSLTLEWDEDHPDLRMANLKFDNDDHTAWVIETRKGSGRYKDFDIGGS